MQAEMNKSQSSKRELKKTQKTGFLGNLEDSQLPAPYVWDDLRNQFSTELNRKKKKTNTHINTKPHRLELFHVK